MADNKFIAKLKGTATPKSVIEIKDDKLVNPLTGIPKSTDGMAGILDDTNTSLVVAKSAKNWVLNGGSLIKSNDDSFLSEFPVSGQGMWVNSSYQFPASPNPSNPVVEIINASSKWVLRLIGRDMFSDNEIIGFSLVVKIGASEIANIDLKTKRQAGFFCKKFIVDFNAVIKANGGSNLTVQLICNDATATGVIYNGKSILTLLDRRIDATDVASDTVTFQELSDKIDEVAEDVQELDEKKVNRAGDTMTGNLTVRNTSPSFVLSHSVYNADASSSLGGTPTNPIWSFAFQDGGVNIDYAQTTSVSFYPVGSKFMNLGKPSNVWKALYTDKINNGADLLVPNRAGTIAVQEDVYKNAADIAALQGVGGALTATDLTAAPTQDLLTKYAVDQIWHGNTDWVWNPATPAASSWNDADGNPHTAAEIFNGTWVNNTNTDPSQQGHKWQLVNTQDTTPTVFLWTDIGQTIVGMATETLAGVVRVGDDSQMVVNSTTGDISLDGTKAESIRGTIGAVATNQGTANAGKILTVGDDGNIELASGASGAGRNIGDIFWTTRTDSALNGAVECNGGTYNTADYTGEGSIGELLESGKLPYVSLAQYASLLTTNSVCGVFGWDGTGTTTFRVPTLQDVFVECGQVSELGDYIPAGLPNITGTFGAHGYNGTSGAFTFTNGNRWIESGGNSVGRGNMDASRSSSIYGNSDTVQPKAIKYRAMIQLFNGTTDEAVATVGTVVAQVGELNAHRVIEFQAPTAENGHTWYRKYADGWVEQGGEANVAIGGTGTKVDFEIEMQDTKYYPSAIGYSASTAYGYGVKDLTTNSMNLVHAATGGTVFMRWSVAGMGV